MEDPVLTSARREATLVLAIWAIAFAWTMGYCYAFGYDLETPPSLVLGIPSWVMFGIFVPWTVATIISYLISSFYMTDEDLGEEMEEERSILEAEREVSRG